MKEKARSEQGSPLSLMLFNINNLKIGQIYTTRIRVSKDMNLNTLQFVNN